MRNPLFRYGVAAALVALAAWGAGVFLSPVDRVSLRVGALLALTVQGGCFAALWWAARRPGGFLAAWAAGILLRLAAVAGFGLWGVSALGLSDPPALLGLAAVLFVLLLLEPLGLPRPAGAVRA